jgi:hypothetical protein
MTWNVGILLLVFATVYLRTGPPAALPADAPADRFSAGRAYDELRRLVGDGIPHPIGSEANARVRARIVARFTELGYQPEVQTTFACNETSQACGTVHNIVAMRSGADTGKAVMLAAHYDSVAAGPGASDDGVGVAAALEVARIVSADPQPRNPIVFLIDDGEEAGLLGAWGFVRGHPLAGRIGAVVNLEARGTSGASVMFETSDGNRWLIDLLARSVARPVASSMFYPIYERLPNDTDLTVFKRAGLAGLNFAFIGDVPRYHTPLDDVAHASRGSLQHHGDNALAMVRALANADLDRPRGGDVVFFDVLAFRIIRWPIGPTAILAWVALALVIAASIVMIVRRTAGAWRSLLGLVAWILMIAAAGGGAWGLLTWMTNRGTWPGGATTAPRVSVLAFWLAGLALASLIASLIGRWSRPGGAWIGCWMAWAIAGVAAAMAFPEAGYLLIVPALVAGATGLTGAYAGRTFRSAAPLVASLIPPAIAAALIMPPAWVLFDAIGPTALPVAGGAIGLIATTLAPAVAASGASRWLLPAAGAVTSAVLLGIVAAAPAFSIDRPERMNVTFLQGSDDRRASWIVTPQSGVLPEAVRAAAPFGAERERALPWSGASGFVAEAPLMPLDGPAVEILDRQPRDAGRTVRLRARSLRGTSTLTLILPPNRIASVTLNGFEFPRRGAAIGGPGRGYTCFAVPPDGVEFVIGIDGDAPVEAWLFDRSEGLPFSGNALIAARPREALPAGTGDVMIVYTRLRL